MCPPCAHKLRSATSPKLQVTHIPLSNGGANARTTIPVPVESSSPVGHSCGHSSIWNGPMGQPRDEGLDDRSRRCTTERFDLGGSARRASRVFRSSKRKDGAELHYLRLRRAYERTVDPDTLRELTDVEIKQLKDSNQYDNARLARRPLVASQVEALMKTAIELQVRAAALEDRSRWWLPLAAAVLGFVGAVLGSLLKGP